MWTRLRNGVALVVVVLGTACGGGSATPDPQAEPPTTAASTVPSSGPPGVRSTAPSTSTVTSAVTSTSAVVPTVPVTALPDPVPEQAGVGGVMSEVDTCRDWSRVTGSYLLLTIAAGFGGLDRPALDRLEVAAAPVVVEAAASLLGTWPAELAAERDVVADGVVAPLTDRARRALAALETTGLGEAGRAELATAWLYVLATQDRSDPAVALPPLSPEVAAAVDAAAVEIAAALARVDLDPALGRAAGSTPLTDAYLVQRCPEVVEVVGADAV